MGPQGIYIMGTGELAAYLGVSLSFVLRSLRAAELPAPYRLGSTLVWRTEDIDRWGSSSGVAMKG